MNNLIELATKLKKYNLRDIKNKLALNPFNLFIKKEDITSILRLNKFIWFINEKFLFSTVFNDFKINGNISTSFLFEDIYFNI